MIAFTSDIDWAPDAVISDMLELFSKFGVKCTLFCTHESEVIKNCDRNLFEIAVHPNFNPLFEGRFRDPSETIDELLRIFPEAKGIRCHDMTQKTSLLNMFAKKGILYDANHFLPYQEIKPFRLWNGMLRIPYNWEDDIHFLYGHSFGDSKIDIDKPGMKIFHFHPVHIFLNTESEERYISSKKHYQDPDKLIECRNSSGVPGSRDLFISLLEKISAEGKETYKLSDIHSIHSNV